jgi:hypothetical protein
VTPSQVFALRSSAAGCGRPARPRERLADSFWPNLTALLIARPDPIRLG